MGPAPAEGSGSADSSDITISVIKVDNDGNTRAATGRTGEFGDRLEVPKERSGGARSVGGKGRK